LVDYAGATAAPSRSEPDTTYEPGKDIDDYLADIQLTSIPDSTMGVIFWGCFACKDGMPGLTIVRAQASAGRPVKFRGVIQRTDWQLVAYPAPEAPGRHLGFTKKMTIEKITDGSSKTIVVAEKWVPPVFYDGSPHVGRAGDDLGWADGWDCNNMRSALFQIRPDSDGEVPASPSGRCDEPHDFPFGSAHSGGINVMYADGSVATVNYDINQELFNLLAHFHDGEIVNLER
jgi:prepilin-type processing-associated H-X9-DG protein